MANARRIAALGVATPTARELANQIEDGGAGGVESVNGQTGEVVLDAGDVGAVAPGDLSDVATSGAYGDLTGTPSLSAVATSGAWADVTGKPATFPATTPVATATALATGRTIALTGGATGTSAAFTGAANASIAVTLATPTASVRGGVIQAAAQADSEATDASELVTDFNALLAKLRTAGVIAT